MPRIVVMAAYMSGDRNTIASAMVLEKSLKLCILGEASDPKTADMLKFFGRFGNRVTMYLSDTKETTKALYQQLSGRGGPAGETAEQLLSLHLAKQFPSTGPKDYVGKLLPPKATEFVSQAFGKNLVKAREQLLAFWEMPGLAKKFESFLATLGFARDKKYVFLWCKTGGFYAEKAHHYTDTATWRVFLTEMAGEGWIPVVAGDDLGLTTNPTMVNFWNRWPDGGMDRYTQFALWVYIWRTYGPNCCSIGMRSGMIEVPALIGIRTLYLEEVENEQRERMASWLGKVDTWYRAILFEPPGIQQYHYYLNTISWTTARKFPMTMKVKSSPSALIYELEAPVRERVVAAMELICRAGASRAVTDCITSYVGLDVKGLPERPMPEASIARIVQWVVNPGASVDEQYDVIAMAVLNAGKALVQRSSGRSTGGNAFGSRGSTGYSTESKFSGGKLLMGNTTLTGSTTDSAMSLTGSTLSLAPGSVGPKTHGPAGNRVPALEAVLEHQQARKELKDQYIKLQELWRKLKPASEAHTRIGKELEVLEKQLR